MCVLNYIEVYFFLVFWVYFEFVIDISDLLENSFMYYYGIAFLKMKKKILLIINIYISLNFPLEYISIEPKNNDRLK